MSRWDSSRILGWASRWPCFRWQHMTSFFCYSASFDPGAIQQFFAKSPHIPFILSITKRWPKGNKNTVRPCCTWMEVGRPAIRWSSGRYGIHKVWIEAMKMWCLFFFQEVICSSKWKHGHATVFSVSIQIGYFWDKGASGVMKSILLSGVFSGPHFAECAACRLWGRLFSGVRLMIWERTYISENLKCNTQHLSEYFFF